MSLPAHLSPSSMLDLMQLPCELRNMIWHEAMPYEISETCILLQASSSTAQQKLSSCYPCTVDTAFPVLMHICHETREFASKRLQFRYSTAARTMVPFRTFRPELDVLYVHGTQSLSSLRYLEEPILKQVRRLAVGCWRPLCAATASRPASAACIFGVFPQVESISIVLPSSKQLPSWQKLYPSPPIGRFRLEPFYTGCTRPSNIISSFKSVDRGFSGVLSFMHRIRCDIACYHARMWQSLGPQIGEDTGFIDVDLTPQYFSVYSKDNFPSSREAFRDVLQFPDGFGPYDMSQLRACGGLNPEKVRVNDLR